MAAAMAAASTAGRPWYVVPADKKENARLVISHIVDFGLSRFRRYLFSTAAGYCRVGAGFLTASAASGLRKTRR